MTNEKLAGIRSVVLPVVSRASGVEVENLHDEDELIRDLDMDSLGILEIAVDLETHYAVEIEDEDLDQIITVGDIIHYIEDRL